MAPSTRSTCPQARALRLLTCSGTSAGTSRCQVAFPGEIPAGDAISFLRLRRSNSQVNPAALGRRIHPERACGGALRRTLRSIPDWRSESGSEFHLHLRGLVNCSLRAYNRGRGGSFWRFRPNRQVLSLRYTLWRRTISAVLVDDYPPLGKRVLMSEIWAMKSACS